MTKDLTCGIQYYEFPGDMEIVTATRIKTATKWHGKVNPPKTKNVNILTLWSGGQGLTHTHFADIRIISITSVNSRKRFESRTFQFVSGETELEFVWWSKALGTHWVLCNLCWYGNFTNTYHHQKYIETEDTCLAGGSKGFAKCLLYFAGWQLSQILIPWTGHHSFKTCNSIVYKTWYFMSKQMIPISIIMTFLWDVTSLLTCLR